MKRLLSILIIAPILTATAPPNYRVLPEPAPTSEVIDEWEVLWIAIAIIESGINDNAQNPQSTALGRYQMLKGTVDDVNRIKKAIVYKYEDRTDPIKAREMVEVIQGHYNPERNIRKAIRIHSIGFSKEAKWLAYADRYEAKVMKIVNEISEISNKNYQLLNN